MKIRRSAGVSACAASLGLTALVLLVPTGGGGEVAAAAAPTPSVWSGPTVPYPVPVTFQPVAHSAPKLPGGSGARLARVSGAARVLDDTPAVLLTPPPTTYRAVDVDEPEPERLTRNTGGVSTSPTPDEPNEQLDDDDPAQDVDGDEQLVRGEVAPVPPDPVESESESNPG